MPQGITAPTSPNDNVAPGRNIQSIGHLVTRFKYPSRTDQLALSASSRWLKHQDWKVGSSPRASSLSIHEPNEHALGFNDYLYPRESRLINILAIVFVVPTVLQFILTIGYAAHYIFAPRHMNGSKGTIIREFGNDPHAPGSQRYVIFVHATQKKQHCNRYLLHLIVHKLIQKVDVSLSLESGPMKSVQVWQDFSAEDTSWQPVFGMVL
ncbi:hypothetical protein SISNIDRAFT_470379 [Sistotremastrum niveocremeum HHB9708]|uniref:Uncharacterized protein n=1 Tax=Sistotremastrum niveocremeum HHB9708 TaxID=1314777 RepID=A0A164P056_9AGAM|nr:hypothetical protein SISNIDRAFT_470379 [Sistotremastrum niveocremeum HHB9708]